MRCPVLPGLLSAALLSAPLFVHAQPAPKSGRPDPMSAQARVPVVPYTSPFAQYRRVGDVEVGPWRAANDTVERIGGWRAYAREASLPEPVAPGSAPAAASGAAHGPMHRPEGHGHGHR